MRKKQFLALFFSILVIWTVGNGLLPLLPVYAKNLGASPDIVGYYLAIVYIAITSGSLLSGWLSDRLQQRKRLIVLVGIITMPVIWLMGQVTNIWQLTVLTSVLWFLGGMNITLKMILAGLFAEKEKRGKVFGFFTMTVPLGAIFGGLMIGRLVDHWGFPNMFSFLSLFWILSPFFSLFLEDKVIEQASDNKIPKYKTKLSLGGMFFLLFFASISVQIAIFMSRLGVSLTMNDLNFTATAISSTGVISGVVSLPIPPLVGWLSDRIGRKRLLAVFYLIASTGMLILTISTSLWHFLTAFSMISILTGANRAVGTALATDLVAKEAIGRGIALFQSSAWMGGIIAFSFTGYAAQNFGMTTTLIIGASLPLLATILLIPIPQTVKVKEAVTV